MEFHHSRQKDRTGSCQNLVWLDQLTYDSFEGEWTVPAASSHFTVSNLGHAIPKDRSTIWLLGLLTGFIPFFYWLAKIFAYSSNRGAPSWGMIIWSLAVAVPVAWSLWPHRQGLRIQARKGELSVLRVHRGIVIKDETFSPTSISVASASKRYLARAEGERDGSSFSLFKTVHVTTSCIYARNEKGNDVELAWAKERGLAVITAIRIARACQVEFRDETVVEPQTVSPDKLVRKRDYHVHSDDFEVGSSPDSLRPRMQVNPREVIFLHKAKGFLAPPSQTLVYPDRIELLQSGAFSPTRKSFPWAAIQSVDYAEGDLWVLIDDKPWLVLDSLHPAEAAWAKDFLEKVSGLSNQAQ